jgi:tripartite-type tricarboxylate transporter receptor subunit TctC
MMRGRSAAAAIAITTATILLALSGSHGAQAQTAGPIKIVVPYAAGGGADILARMLADRIGAAHQVTMIVENRAGGGTVIGTEAVSRAAPDGNTLLIITDTFVVTPHLRKLSYDPLTGFEPVCNLAATPQAVVVNAASPYRTIADLVAAARARPGTLTVASPGPASAAHVTIEMFKRASGADLTYIPYPGIAPALSALLGDHITAAFSTYAAVAEQIRTGKLRALAAASVARIDGLPEVPTLTDLGYKDLEADLWYGLYAPAKTPPATLTQLAGWFAAALRLSEIRPKLDAQGLAPVALCGAEFAAYLRRQYDKYGRGIREANIKAE